MKFLLNIQFQEILKIRFKKTTNVKYSKVASPSPRKAPQGYSKER